MISVVIPVYNEERALREKENYYRDLAKTTELIFVDGASSDQTLFLAQGYGKVIQTAKGRARQMNQGARQAHGEILLFLHADALLDTAYLEKITEVVTRQNYIGGCFSQRFKEEALIYRWIAWTGNMRAKVFKIFYGDQGIFVRKDVFWRIGGFPPMRLGEDIFFTKKLKKEGKVRMLSYPIYCSARRWANQGILKTFFLNLRINAALSLGYDVDKLAGIYRDVRDDG